MSSIDHRCLTFERGPRISFDLDTTLDEHVAAQVRRTPSAIAVSDDRESLTYGEAWHHTLDLVATLEARGVHRNSTVAVCCERSVHLPLLLLAILRSGAAYCPLPPDQPAGRLRHFLEQAQPHAIVLAPAFEGLIADAARGTWAGEQIVLGDKHTLSLPPAVLDCERHDRAKSCPTDPAYVIFTSGSTGHPKGVVVPHRAVVNRLLWMQHQFGLTSQDTVLQKTPYGFDVSVWELFWPLLAGARLHLAEPDGHRDPRYLAECIVRQRVSTVHFVPSMLAAFLQDPLAARCRSLRHVISSGEELPGSLMLDALRALRPEGLWNLYGPTEATIDVTAWRCREQYATGRVPIGHPIANVDCVVLDEDGERTQVGAAGELYIGGVQVASGYIDDPDLTAERFVERAAYDGTVYRTGDLVSWREDGTLDFHGRIDRQVKLHGNRIELGEIEIAIARLPGIACAAVLLRDDVGAVPKIVAYLVARGDDRSDLESRVRRELAYALPAYMLPSFLVTLPSLPTTANGKLDRSALPLPPSARRAPPLA